MMNVEEKKTAKISNIERSILNFQRLGARSQLPETRNQTPPPLPPTNLRSPSFARRGNFRIQISNIERSILNFQSRKPEAGSQTPPPLPPTNLRSPSFARRGNFRIQISNIERSILNFQSRKPEASCQKPETRLHHPCHPQTCAPHPSPGGEILEYKFPILNAQY
jgi:hypothetical protein